MWSSIPNCTKLTNDNQDTRKNYHGYISASFPVLLLTGPHQIGKTTLLEKLAEEDRNYVSLDDLDERRLAQQDPALFLQTHKPPLIIDEIQYAPILFSYIKMYVDKHKISGLFWLTGSQKFHLMKGIQESLAGRVAIIDMLGLSGKEIENKAEESVPFLQSRKWLEKYSEHKSEGHRQVKLNYGNM